MELFIPISLNCFFAMFFYLVDRYTSANKLSYKVKQVIVGITFGLLSCYASESGMEVLETFANVRDAAPLTAGLVFGAPAGIISGVMGGLYRWFSVFWGAGTYTRLACTMGTIFAGVMAATLRIYMFDDKKTTWGYGVCIAVVCEVIHMLLIFLTNMGDSTYAFEFVKGATFPMVVGNALAVGSAILVVSWLSYDRQINEKVTEQISQTFQRWLLTSVVFAFMITSVFTFLLQDEIAELETESVFTSAIEDVKNDVRGKSDDYMLSVVEDVVEDFEKNPTISLKQLAIKHNVIEINVVDESGLVLDSTQDNLIQSFNMNSTEQSKEFMVLVEEQTTYVQEYGPVGSDGVTMRKFAGKSISTGGFIQIGYDAEQFHTMLDEFVIDVTKNRHVGSKGFLLICDENLNVVSNSEENGQHIEVMGITPDQDMLNKKSAKKLYEAELLNKESGEFEKYIYVYTFEEGYCILAATPKEEAMLMRDTSIFNSIFMQVLIFAALFIIIYFLIKKVIINNLKKINNSLAQITEGNLNVTVDVRSNEEFASLSDDINSTVATLKRYIAEAAARIDKELEYAKQIQLSALPTNYPDNEEYKIYAEMIAAKEIGGDFYDFYKLNDRTVAFLAADVSGKGIPAAMFMMSAKTIIKDLAESGLSVNDIFTRANEKLCENNESGMFVTAWMGILDVKTGKLQYANAGHNPPLLKREKGGFEYLRSRAGFVLAGMEGVRYRVNEIELEAGDRIFLYTDGVTEATNTSEKLYGEDRLLAYMNKNKTVDSTVLLPGLKEDIDNFVGEAPQFDDITMLMFDYKLNKRGLKMSERVFPAKVDALNDVLGYVEETLDSFECSMKTNIAICVAIEEVFVNVANYAYGNEEGNVDFSIAFDEESREVTFRMADKGIPFDPLKKEDPDITLSVEERDIGGLGIFITKKTMDSIEYAYENNENVLTMKKKI